MKMKLKKLDYVNAAAIVFSVLGLLLEIAGGMMSTPETVGLNLSLSPAVFVGAGVVVLGLVCAIFGSMKTEREGLDKRLSSIALYVAVIALLIVPIVIVLTIVMPVLDPSNG